MMLQKDLEMSLVKPELTDSRLYVSCNHCNVHFITEYRNRIESKQFKGEKRTTLTLARISRFNLKIFTLSTLR